MKERRTEKKNFNSKQKKKNYGSYKVRPVIKEGQIDSLAKDTVIIMKSSFLHMTNFFVNKKNWKLRYEFTETDKPYIRI